MKKTLIAAAAAFVASLSAFAAPRARALPELTLRALYTTSTEPLTTEKVWGFDPDELNPHRARWVLDRDVKLEGLKAREIPGAPEGARYGATAETLLARTSAHFRPEGPWYRPMTEYPCQSEPVSWFGTRGGAQKAADAAAHEWERELAEGKLKLGVLLSRVTASSPELAVKKGEALFELWLKEISEVWRAEGRQKGRREEWKFYRDRASQEGFCKAERPSKPAAWMAWDRMMEPPATGEKGRAGFPKDELKLVARAPAKRMDGLYTIRLNVTIAGRKLNGRFLIHSGVGTSLISPDWLEGQGILPAWVEVPGAKPKRAPWGGGSGALTGGLAPVVSVDQVSVGNSPVALTEFALFDTELFSPPESATPCCDGVLGTDFLRKYVVEFQPGPPTEVKLWPAENFHIAEEQQAQWQWIEEGMTPAGEPVSACLARAGSFQLVGTRWDTGRRGGLDIHLPWQKEARAAIGRSKGGNSWDLACGSAPASEPLVKGMPATFPKLSPYELKAIHDKVPAFSIGMALLGSDRAFLDFPHGRIWLPKKMSAKGAALNHSGLTVRFSAAKGRTNERALFVRGIAPRSPASELAAQGLRAGMEITQVDSIDPGLMDAWEVEQHLAGAFGDKVLVQWKTPRGLKLGAMQVRTKP